MSETVRIYVESTELKGEKGPVMVKYQVKDGPKGAAKAWPDANLKQGEKYDVILETKDGKFGEETWIKIPKSGRPGGGFGGGKPDPARAENDRKRLELEERKQEDFQKKWSADRKAEAERQASIASQVILKAAVDLAIASGHPEPSAAHGFAIDLAETLKQTHEQVFNAIASRALRGQQ